MIPTFSEERNEERNGWRYLRVRMDHPDRAESIRIDLAHHPEVHANGHWHVDMVGRPEGKGYNPRENEAANMFGPRAVRALATHLKQTYGIRQVSGARVTGTRAGKWQTSKDVSVDLGKAIKLTAHQPFPVQAGANKQVAHDWHHEGTSANPMNEHQRVVTSGEATGVYRLKEDPMRMNHYHVQDVRAVTRGGGRAAMDHLTRMADQHKVSLQLVAEPLNPGSGEGKKLTRRELRSWYHGFGFRPKQGDLLVRTPNLRKSFSELYGAIQKL